MQGKKLLVIAGLVAALFNLSCSSEEKNTSPVMLVGTVSQDIQVVDLASTTCGQLGTINLKAIIKRTDVADTRFLDVQLRQMAVSYERTDGGTTVPQSFTQSISGLLPANGGDQTLNDFFIFQVDAFTQAPFAALLPNNGGVDPQTGLRTVKMNAIIDIYGRTLSGDDTNTRVKIPLTFCYDCGGCR